MNLVIIVSDTYRWDYMGVYGNDWIKTPNLDQLASESALFLDAYAEGLPTIPARRVVLTGRPIFPFTYRPQKSDQVQLHGWHPLFDEDVALSEYLREYDYVSAFVTDVYHTMKPGKNFHRGFDGWYWIRGQEGDPSALRDKARVADLLAEASYGGPMRERAWIIQHLMNRKDWKGEEDTSVAKVMMQAADWIRDYTLTNPFFVYVDCFDPHEPWDPPLEYAKQYDPGYSGLDGLIPPGRTEQMTGEQVSHVRTAYAAEVSLVDRWIGHLLDTLRETGRMENTLVVFTSDHGAMLGEQGELHKGADRLRNQCTRLPLLIRHPENEAAGQKAHGFVQHQDIMATALRLMGLPIPDRVLGDNIWPLITGKPSSRETIVTAFGHYASVRTARWNCVTPWAELPTRHSPRHDLYDLEDDPEELTNVVDDHPNVVKELSDWLSAHIEKLGSQVQGTFQSHARGEKGMSFDALPSLKKER